MRASAGVAERCGPHYTPRSETHLLSDTGASLAGDPFKNKGPCGATHSGTPVMQ